MRLMFKIYSIEILILASLFSVLSMGVINTIFALKEEEVLVITKDKGHFEVLDKKENVSLEVENFFREFIGLSLNFDPSSFNKNISKAGDLMTKNLWVKKSQEFLNLSSYVSKNKIIQSSQILSIKKTNNNIYEVKIKMRKIKKENLEESTKTLLIYLSENKRSQLNPWRYNVSSIVIK